MPIPAVSTIAVTGSRMCRGVLQPPVPTSGRGFGAAPNSTKRWVAK
jgi:hypothetical protein